MATKLETKYQCDECGEIHDYEDDAHECCQPSVSEVYICPECGDSHRKESDALDCCGYDEDAPPPPISLEDLEKAGQMRLIA